MKVKRYKKAQQILNYYWNNFGFREPFQVLLDGTFCFTALENKVSVEQQLQKYFQMKIKLITTQCIIIEMENLGPKFIGAINIIKNCNVHKCGHEKNIISGAACIKSMIKQSHYIVATQDRDLQNSLRATPGQPLLFLHRHTPTLEAISEASKKFIQRRSKNLVSETQLKKLETLKKQEGIIELQDNKAKKRKIPKNPNPLSCKKKKIRPKQNSLKNAEHLKETKIPRKRIRISKHIKEEMIKLKKYN